MQPLRGRKARAGPRQQGGEPVRLDGGVSGQNLSSVWGTQLIQALLVWGYRCSVRKAVERGSAIHHLNNFSSALRAPADSWDTEDWKKNITEVFQRPLPGWGAAKQPLPQSKRLESWRASCTSAWKQISSGPIQHIVDTFTAVGVSLSVAQVWSVLALS